MGISRGVLHSDFLNDLKSTKNHPNFSGTGRISLDTDCIPTDEFYIEKEANIYNPALCVDGRTWNDREQSEPYGSWFNHSTAEREYDPILFDWKRSPVEQQALHFENVCHPLAWFSSEVEETVNSKSSWSDESRPSPSSSMNRTPAPTCDRKDELLLPMRLNGSRTNRKNEFQKRLDKRYGLKDLSVDNMIIGNVEEILLGNDMDKEGKPRSSPNDWRSGSDDCFKKPFTIQGFSKNHDPFSFEEGYASFDADSAPDAFLRTSRADGTSFGYKPSRSIHFDTLKDFVMHPRKDLDIRGSTHNDPIDHNCCGSLYFDIDPIIEEPDIGSQLKNPSLHPLEETEQSSFSSWSEDHPRDVQFPELSKTQNVSKDKDESEFCSTNCGGMPSKANDKSSTDDNVSSSKRVIVTDTGTSESKQEEVQGETPDLSENKRSGNSSQLADSPTATEQVSSEQNPDPFDSVVPAPLQSGDEVRAIQQVVEVQHVVRHGNEDPAKWNSVAERIKIGKKTADSPYKVMLESYVLQLLCVQKVLLDSSVQDPVKKA